MKPAKSSVRSRAVLAVVSFCGAGALAVPSATVVLVGEASPAFRRELAAEASEVGLALSADEHGDPARALNERGATAVIRVLSQQRVELWFPEDRSGAPTRETLGATADETEPFAARVMEQVRAHLVKLAVLRAPERRDVPPHAAEPPAARAAKDDTRRSGAGGESRRLLWAETGVGVTAAAGGVPAAVQALLGLRLSPGTVEATAFGLLPLADASVAAREGSAAFTATMIGGDLGYVLTDESAALQGVLGAGGGALHLSMQGDAPPPYAGHSVSVTTAALFVHGGVRYRVAKWLGIRASTLVGLSAPRPVVEFAGRDVAAWGRTFGTLVVSLELGVVGRAP